MSALPPPSASAPHRRADAARNHVALLEAARAVFAEEGLDAPITAITRRAGCAKGTFFRHFPTKDDLISALLADRLQQMHAIAEAAEHDHPPGWAALSAMVEGFQVLMAPDRSFMPALIRRDTDLARTRAGIDQLDRQVERVLRAAQELGDVRPDVAHTDIQLIAMAITNATAPLHDTDPLLGRRLLRIMLDGFRAGETTALGAPAVTPARLRTAKAAGSLPPPGACGAPST